MAARRLAPILPPTPLRASLWLTRRADRPVYLKLESIQPTGSFKVRGAHNKVLSILERAGAHKGAGALKADAPAATAAGLGRAGARGVVTASSGNHGAALAMAGESVGLPVTVVVPEGTPRAKVENMTARGAKVVFHGAIWDDAEREALRLAATAETGVEELGPADTGGSRGAAYVSAFADREVIAGQGTIGLEILAQLGARLGEAGTVVLPVGGGGLISGVAMAVKSTRPGVKVIGVQPEASRPMFESFRAGRMVEVEHGHTLSEGTAGGISAATLAAVLALVDDVVTVTEEAIAGAMRDLVFREHVVAEGAGALATAALVSEALPPGLPGPIVLVVSGGNVDPDALTRVLGG